MAERQLPKLNVAGSIPVSRSSLMLSVPRAAGKARCQCLTGRPGFFDGATIAERRCNLVIRYRGWVE